MRSSSFWQQQRRPSNFSRAISAGRRRPASPPVDRRWCNCVRCQKNRDRERQDQQCNAEQQQNNAVAVVETSAPLPLVQPLVASTFAGRWGDWPITSLDTNFDLTRVYSARWCTVGNVLLLRTSVRGSHRLTDDSVSLSLPPGVRAATNGGDQFSVAIIHSVDGVGFAQAYVQPGGTSILLRQPALEPNVLYTVSLNMILEVEPLSS